MKITPEELYNSYCEKVERYICSHVGNEHDRADIVQQVFLNAISALEGYDPERAAVSTWLYAITRNAVIDYYRNLEKTPLSADDDELQLSSSDEKPLSEETLETLADALEQLPERERKIIVLRFYSGYSAKETAKKVGISYANVRFLQYTALKKLRRFLEEAGLFE